MRRKEIEDADFLPRERRERIKVWDDAWKKRDRGVFSTGCSLDEVANDDEARRTEQELCQNRDCTSGPSQESRGGSLRSKAVWMPKYRYFGSRLDDVFCPSVVCLSIGSGLAQG